MRQTFIELTVVTSELTNVPVPRRALVDIKEIASIEELGEKTPLRDRCLVTLYEASDSVVESESGEQPLRHRRSLNVKESYDSLRTLLAAHSTIVRTDA